MVYLFNKGGNELGTGNIYDKLIDSNVKFAKEIGCVIKSDICIICSVSNWGAYALALSLLLIKKIEKKVFLIYEVIR